MKYAQLRAEVELELDALERTVLELLSVQNDVAGREPTVREKTAAAAFLAQFYNGIENILRRISRHLNVPLPAGETWHIDLFRRFCRPSYPGLPVLFEPDLALALSPYRQFRHVVFHGYGFQLDWDRMAEGIVQISDVFSTFRAALLEYLRTLDS